jgi:non-hemolytic enterotoxin B/C
MKNDTNVAEAPTETAAPVLRSSAKLLIMQPSAQQLTDYANAMIMVNSYAYAITNQQMPILQYPTPHYGDFTSKFAPAKQHALNWSTNIFVSMIQLPETIVNQAADLFNMESLMINAYLQALVSDPSNAAAKKGLASALTTVSQLIQTQVTTVTNIQRQLVTFNTNILTDAQTLTQLAALALSEVQTDKQNIEGLNADIKNLNDSISTAQKVLTAAEIGIGLSLFVGLIGAVVCLIPGSQLVGGGIIALAVAGEVASIALTVVESKAIEAMQGAITDKRKEITARNQDIILLQGVSAQFNNLYQANLKAQAALATINGMWNLLNTVVNDVASELADVSKDASSSAYQQAITDFQKAQSGWNDLITFADALAKIDYNWQDASGTWHKYGQQNPEANNGNMNQIQQSA